MSSQLEVSDRSLRRSIRLVVLRGQLTRTTMPHVAATLKTACWREPGVIVDISQLASLDASGIALLDDTWARLADAGGRMAIVVSDEHADASLPAAPRWNSTVDVFHSRSEAIAAVNRHVLLVRPTAVRALLDVPIG